jgi:predicted kinase
LCYTNLYMGKWNRFRRSKKKAAPTQESESTGRVGQPLNPGQSALQPSYLDEEAQAESGSEERAPKIHMETQPESPSSPPAPPSLATGHPPNKAPRAPKGVVVLAIGLPGSGKTTWFKRRGVAPLSSDMLRSILFDDITEQRYQSLVFSTLRSLLRARLIARMPWNYVDATNLSPRERRQWIQMARQLGYEVQAVFFDVPLEVCLERNSRRERMVSEDIMRRMAAKLRPPTFEEGFSKIVVVRVKSKEGNAEPAETEF